jgi:molybdopterin adenylyltransferase
MSQNQYKILSLNLAKERGRKFPVNKFNLISKGVEGDIHKGTTRQVSIISNNHIQKFIEHTSSRKPEFGEFAENITLEAIKEDTVKVFDRFRTENIELEVTQIGKPFHDKFRELGNYVMPKVGIFCRVLKTGKLEIGESLIHIQKTFKILVITLSDRASKGEYEDKSGPEIIGMLNNFFSKKGHRIHIEHKIISDDANELEQLIKDGINNQTDIIFTTGGTGIGPRDITIETVQPLIQKEIPGIMEHIRIKYGSKKPNALLSRGIAGTINDSIVYTLPGSVKAVKEYMTEILNTLEHLLFMIKGIDNH